MIGRFYDIIKWLWCYSQVSRPSNLTSFILWKLTVSNLMFFSFGLADDQKSFNAACNNIFLAFLSSHYGFLHYFELFSFLSSYITQGRNPPCQTSSSLDMYFQLKYSSKNHKIKFFNHFVEFTVEQILKSFSRKNNSPEPHVFCSF